MKADEHASLAVARGRRAYVHLINGRLQLESDGQVGLLDAGDGTALETVGELRFVAEEGNLEALVFDLP
jgi:redox-sensitive bicupin YhaK (pirin superfamily)